MLTALALKGGHGFAGSVLGRGRFPVNSSVENARLEGFRTCIKKNHRRGLHTSHASSEGGRTWSVSRAPQCSSSSSNNVQATQMGVPRAEQLEQYLDNIYSAMGLQNHNPRQHITASGVQISMGMEGQWRLTWNTDGRFYESYAGPELQFEWAYDGKLGPWCADAAGRVSSLDLDDKEVCLLASWVRTGYWLTEEGQKQLSIRLEEQNSDSRETTFRLQLKKSKVVAYLAVEQGTWLPLRLRIEAFGSQDTWEFGDWQPVLRGYSRQFPRAVVHNPPAGGTDVYSLASIKVESFDGDLEDTETGTGRLYIKPTASLVPRLTWSYPKTRLNNELSSCVTMIQAESGHYLVRPLINGKDIGYFIVDTGASSLTISPNKAEELEMYHFGEAYVTGIEGEVRLKVLTSSTSERTLKINNPGRLHVQESVKCQFRRAECFQIGPLTITEPIFMEVPMAGVVRGISPVAGICGYDIFCHCIVEISYQRATLSLYDPLAYLSVTQPTQWQNMYLLDNVPHIPATFNGNEVIFLLDTGAGGVDLIFNGRAVERYNLSSTLELAGSASVKGINTSGKGLQVRFGILDSLLVAGKSFRKVKVLFPTVGTCGSLDFSEYTAGVLCGDLLKNIHLVLDYSQRRFAFIDSGSNAYSFRSIG